MIRINKISTFMAYADQLPPDVLEDINQRMTDWIQSGGTMEDPYIQQQFSYAERVLNQVKEQEEIPFVAFGNGELDGNDTVGTYEICPECGEEHEVGYGEKVNPDGTREPSKLLAFITCTKSGATYLIGIKGKKIK